MKVITRAEAKLNKNDILASILKGEIFIHPTDTIYGLGCNAKLSSAVKKIRELKQRPDTPFSVMAPSVEWIRENCVITKEAEEWLKKLPGPYTLILKTKDSPVAPEVVPGNNTLGVRIPDHWFAKLVQELDVPVITTSVNKTDQEFMTSTDNLDSEIKANVDFAIYEGEKQGRPSNIVHLEGEETKIRER